MKKNCNKLNKKEKDDKFLSEIQKEKMQELWDNKEDEKLDKELFSKN